MEFKRYGLPHGSSPTENFQTKFKDFYSLSFFTVGENGNIFIADINLKPEFDSMIEDLAITSRREIVLFDSVDLTTGLLSMLPTEEYLISNPIALLFPGTGSDRVLTYMSALAPELINELESQGKIIQFQCKRSMRTSLGNIVALPEVAFPVKFDPSLLRYSKLIIIDDVIVSGQTMQAVKYALLRKLPYTNSLPPIEAYTWLFLDPKKRAKLSKSNSSSSSSVPDIDLLKTVVTYRGVTGTPPCNSISTLAYGGPKSEVVSTGLRNKYFPSASFDKFISSLQSSDVGCER